MGEVEGELGEGVLVQGLDCGVLGLLGHAVAVVTLEGVETG